jgi:hypothetical protein
MGVCLASHLPLLLIELDNFLRGELGFDSRLVITGNEEKRLCIVSRAHVARTSVVSHPSAIGQNLRTPAHSIISRCPAAESWQGGAVLGSG